MFPPGIKPSRPNLVFIMADRFRGDAMGCMGKGTRTDSNLDRLASEGILFTDAVSSYPVSSPARAMLMTGMYPAANRVTGNCNSQSTPYGVELSEEAVCWSDVLKEEGYRTAYIGKVASRCPVPPPTWIRTTTKGEVAWNEWCPPERRHGFDKWIAYGTYDNHLKPMYWDTKSGREEFYYVNQWGPAYEADRAIEFIRTGRHKNRPSLCHGGVYGSPRIRATTGARNLQRLDDSLDVEALARQLPYIPEREPLKATTSAKTSATTTPASPE